MMHTVGPWELKKTTERTYKINICSQKGYVAHIECVDIKSCETCEANARLIVAAPELYDFLIKFMQPGQGRTFQQDFDEARVLLLKIGNI